MQSGNSKKETFYVFDVLFRDGNWKTWGIGTILAGAIIMGVGNASVKTNQSDLEKKISSTNQITIEKINKNNIYINMPMNQAY